MSGDDLAVEAGVEEARPAGEQDVVCRGDPNLHTGLQSLMYCGLSSIEHLLGQDPCDEDVLQVEERGGETGVVELGRRLPGRVQHGTGQEADLAGEEVAGAGEPGREHCTALPNPQLWV